MVRETVVGAGRVVLLWGVYLGLQLSNEGRRRCSPASLAILSAQASIGQTGPGSLLAACV